MVGSRSSRPEPLAPPVHLSRLPSDQYCKDSFRLSTSDDADVRPAGPRHPISPVANSEATSRRNNRSSRKRNHPREPTTTTTTSTALANAVKDAFAGIKKWATAVPQQQRPEEEDIVFSHPPSSPYVYDSTRDQHPQPLASSSNPLQSTLLQDLFSPFTACGADFGSSTAAFTETTGPKLRQVQHAVVKSLEHFRTTDKRETQRDDDDDEVCSLFSEDDTQLRRLASWNTFGTTDSVGTTETLEAILKKLEDDDGNVIPPKLLARAARRRRKVVQFSYPPTTSLRQCPRPDPDSLGDLFFTEAELDEIENDRAATDWIDDVEIVAVANTPRAQASPQPRSPPPATSLRRAPTPFPKGGAASTASFDTETTKTTKSSKRDAALIKGVQIYLRERSTNAAS